MNVLNNLMKANIVKYTVEHTALIETFWLIFLIYCQSNRRFCTKTLNHCDLHSRKKKVLHKTLQ